MTTVITYGTFDVFHRGHLRLLERAKALGDRLIVGVTSPEFDRNRGKLNVSEGLHERIRNVEATGLADLILVEEHQGQKIRDVLQFKADIFAIGSDWEGHFDYLNRYCRVVYLPRTPGVSSTQVRADQSRHLRLGIVGTGRIAHRMVAEAKYVSGAEVTSVYNPRQESALSFMRTHGLLAAYSKWDEFISEVDAAYVATPHHTHMEYAQMALASGRHVLCEKPASLSVADLVTAKRLADQKNLVFLEGVKTAFLPGFERMIHLVHSGVIGEVRAIRCSFTKLVPASQREWRAPSAGSMTELGSYGLLPILKILGSRPPQGSFVVHAENGVDAFTSARFVYPDAIGSFDVGLGVKSEGSLIVSGTTGFLRVPAPWWLTRSFEIHREDPSLIEQVSVPFEGDGLRYELSEFVRLINTPGETSIAMPFSDSLVAASVMEGFLAGDGVMSIGDRRGSRDERAEGAGKEGHFAEQGAAARQVARALVGGPSTELVPSQVVGGPRSDAP